MKANELRIGNWVKKQYDKRWPKEPLNMQVDFMDYDHLVPEYGYYINGTHEKHIEPIPLTPEILEKAAFKAINHIDGYTFHTLSRKSGVHIDIYKHKTLINGYMLPCHIQYVHQLQNLYFALTGSELQINL